MKKIIIRLLLLPLGFIKNLFYLANEGARDLHNKIRFKNAIIDNGCCIDQRSKIAPFTHILSNCIINNSIINSYSYVGRNCLIQNTEIGSFCSIANDVIIGLGNHPIDLFSTSPIFYRVNNPLKIKLIKEDLKIEEYKNIKIENDVWIGARAIILDGVNIKTGAIIASGAVVTKDVPAYAIVAGIPAKIIKYRFNEKTCRDLLKSKWWEKNIDEILPIANRFNFYNKDESH
jgi:acetyltransferase-like isoleucine patch superfamily enzyme